jgi:dihydrodipicolinate synthase/N-acetylneuraminate lyase
LSLAAHAERIGADAVACLTPFYYQPGDDAIVEHFLRLSEATTLPVFIYNIPGNTGNNVSASLLAKLCKIKGVVGIKDSSRDFSQLLDYLQVVPKGFNVVNGTDSYHFSAFCAGVRAGVSATACVVPELFVEMYEAYRARDLEKGKILQLKINAARALLSKPPLAPLLEALKMRGLKGGAVKAPLRSMTSTEVAELHESLSRLLPELRLSGS